MSKPITKTELDQMECHCGKTGCDIFLHAKCHRGAPLEVSYNKATGILKCNCGVCKTHVVDIQMAPLFVAEPAAAVEPAAEVKAVEVTCTCGFITVFPGAAVDEIYNGVWGQIKCPECDARLNDIFKTIIDQKTKDAANTTTSGD